MSERQPSIYILASKRNGTLYVGVTGDLFHRIERHKSGLDKGFTRRYRVYMLVYYEFHETMMEAITREKQIKKWRREWKLRLIEEYNPDWRDLYDDFEVE